MLHCRRRCDHKMALSGFVQGDRVKATVVMNGNLESSFNVCNTHIFLIYSMFFCLAWLQWVLLTSRCNNTKAEVPPHSFAGSVDAPSMCNSRAASEEVWCWCCRNSSGIPADGIYCIVQSLATGTGPKIWEIHFSWMLSCHHVHRSDCGQDKHHKFPVSQQFSLLTWTSRVLLLEQRAGTTTPLLTWPIYFHFPSGLFKIQHNMGVQAPNSELRVPQPCSKELWNAALCLLNKKNNFSPLVAGDTSAVRSYLFIISVFRV